MTVAGSNYLEHRDHVVGTLEGCLQVRRRPDARRGAPCLNQSQGDDLRRRKPALVDVVETQVEFVAQIGEGEQITDEATGEHGAARPDECDRYHFASPRMRHHFIDASGGSPEPAMLPVELATRGPT